MADNQDIKNKNKEAIFGKKKEDEQKNIEKDLFKNSIEAKKLTKDIQDSAAILTGTLTKTIRTMAEVANPVNYQSFLRNVLSGAITFGEGFSESIKRLLPSGMRENFDRLSKIVSVISRDFAGMITDLNSLTDGFIDIRRELLSATASGGELTGVLSESKEIYDSYNNALIEVAKQTGKTFDAIASGVSEYIRTSNLIASGNLKQADSVTRTRAAFKAYADTVILSRQVGVSLQNAVYLQKQAFENYGITIDKFNKLMLLTSAAFRGTGISIESAISNLTSITDDFKYLNIELENVSKNLSAFIKLSNTRDIFKSPKQALETYIQTLKGVADIQNDFAKSAFFGMMAGQIGRAGYGAGGLADALKFMGEETIEAQRLIFDILKDMAVGRGGEIITAEEAKKSPDLSSQYVYQNLLFQSFIGQQMRPMQIDRLLRSLKSDNFEAFQQALKDTEGEVLTITRSSELINEANNSYAKNLYTLGETTTAHMSNIYMTFGNVVTNISKDLNEKLAQSIGSASNAIIDFTKNITNANNILLGKTKTQIKTETEEKKVVETPQQKQIINIEKSNFTKEVYEASKKGPLDLLTTMKNNFINLFTDTKKTPDSIRYPRSIIINNNLDKLKEIKIQSNDVDTYINENRKTIETLKKLDNKQIINNIDNKEIINESNYNLDNRNIDNKSYNINNNNIRNENNIENIKNESKFIENNIIEKREEQKSVYDNYSNRLLEELKKKNIDDNLIKNKLLSGVMQQKTIEVISSTKEGYVELDTKYFDRLFEKIEDLNKKPEKPIEIGYNTLERYNDLKYLNEKIDKLNVNANVDNINKNIYQRGSLEVQRINKVTEQITNENREVYLNINLIVDGNKLANVLIKNEQLSNYFKNNYNKINEEIYINNGNYQNKRSV